MTAYNTRWLYSVVLLLLPLLLFLSLTTRIAPAAAAASSSSVLTVSSFSSSARRRWARKLLPHSWRRAVAGEDDYTPLLFFTIPRGLLPECDAMEDAVRQVERELNVRVERMDILRQPANEALLQLITQQQRTAPFLYHRESCQSVHLTPAQAGASSGGSSSNKKGKQQQATRGKKDIFINHDRIRAWAKGRYLMAHSASALAMEDGSMAAKKVTAPQLGSSGNELDAEGAMDQAELLEEMALTPEQLKGKRLMEERTKAKAKQQKAKKS